MDKSMSQILTKLKYHVPISNKMPQSGVGSMQGKNSGNMPSAVCALSMNKSKQDKSSNLQDLSKALRGPI